MRQGREKGGNLCAREGRRGVICAPGKGEGG